MPGMVLDFDSFLSLYLMEYLDLEKGDVVIIGTADTATGAEIGAKTAALELVGGKTD